MEVSTTEVLSTKQAQVYEELRRLLTLGDIAPGERINIRQVARGFGVSEIPVREAIKALETEGLVQAVPYAGVIATPISESEFRDIAETRLLIEPVATALATPYLNQADLDVLRQGLCQMDDFLAGNDQLGFAGLDHDFHWLIYERCPNRRMREILKQLWVASKRNILGLHLLPGHAKMSQQEHHALFDALAVGDAEAAQAAAENHRRGVSTRLGELFARQGHDSKSLDVGGRKTPSGGMGGAQDG